MAAFKGYNASVTWAGGHSDSTLNAHEWSLTVEADELDTTDFTSTGWRTFESGLMNWSGSITVKMDDVTALPSPGDVATELKCKILAAFGFKGNAYVSSINPSATVEGVGAATVNFRGTGALTIGAV